MHKINRLKKLIISVFPVVFLASVTFEVSAHPTGGEIRKVRGCNKIVKKAKRRACKRCVTRPRKHHFHPRARAGRRCMRNGVRRPGPGARRGIRRPRGCNRLGRFKRYWCKRCFRRPGVRVYRPWAYPGKRCRRIR